MEEYILAALTAALSGVDPTTKQSKFLSGAMTKGGVEGWLQVELAAAFYGTGAHQVLREQSVFTNPRKAVDFVFDDTSTQALLELKVETLFSSARMGSESDDHTLWLSVFKDYVKLQLEVLEDYVDTPSFVSAVCWSQGAVDALENFIVTNDLTRQSQRIEARFGGEDVQLYLYVIAVERGG